MMAGCCVDDCGWTPIGIIIFDGEDCDMDENKKGPFDCECGCCEDKQSVPTPAYLDWVRERMSHEEYISYLSGKYYEALYYYINGGYHNDELAIMNFYLEQILSEKK